MSSGPLPPRFVEHQCGRHGDVERFHTGAHRNGDTAVGVGEVVLWKTGAFVADEQQRGVLEGRLG